MFLFVGVLASMKRNKERCYGWEGRSARWFIDFMVVLLTNEILLVRQP